MPKKPTLSPEDKALFEKAMKDVTPLKHKKNKVYVSKQPAIKKIAPKKELADEPVMNVFLTDPQELDIHSETILAFHKSGLNDRLLKKLRRGEIAIEAVLDMHQFTVEQARSALSDFLLQSVERGFRVVRLIHGKGQRESDYARLKTFINHWLPQFNFVLAFHSCPPNQGGTGAVNILLKKNF